MEAVVGPSIAQSYSHERTKTPTVTRLLSDPISSSLIDANSCFVYHQSIMLSCIPIHPPKEIARGEWRDDHEGRRLWRTSTSRGLHALLCLLPDPRCARLSLEGRVNAVTAPSLVTAYDAETNPIWSGLALPLFAWLSCTQGYWKSFCAKVGK